LVATLAVALGALLLSGPTSAEPAEALIAREIAARYPDEVAGGEVIVRLPVSIRREPESLEAIRWDPATSRFEAVLRFDGRLARMAGSARAEVEVPVLTRAVQPGELISASDVSMARVPVGRSLDTAVTSLDGLVGKEARKTITPGRIVPADAVGERPVIQRNRTVTMIYRKGALTLTAKGKALTNALEGEEVRVAPPGGGQPVVGIARSDGTVLVGG